MSKTASAVYAPPQDGLPYLAVVFLDGRIAACQPASTKDEAQAMIASIENELPAIVAQANRDQDETDKERTKARI